MRKSFTVVLFILCFSLAAFGQAGLGGIIGNVRDASGAAITGAKVIVSNPSKGITRELTTTDSGLFSAPALVPSGGYQISVAKQGFAPYQATDITVEVGGTISLNIALKVGAVAEKVEVSAESIILDGSKTEVSGVVNTEMITDLPINGRRVDQFVILMPAVTTDATFGLVTFRGMAGGNSFLLDGNDTTDSFYNENAGRTRLGAQVSQDAVQEFQVLTSAYSAEFGKSNGGTINTITKSGTNNLHGTIFEFFRNRTLDAIDRYSTVNVNGVISPFDPPEKRNQFGGTIGGPIKKDKLFAFFNYEGQRRTFPMVDSITGNANVNPATETWIGCAATAAQCNAINALLPRLFGLAPRTGNQDLFFLKFDYRPSEKHSFTFDFNYLKWLSQDGIQTGIASTSGAAFESNGNDAVRDRIGKASWTYVPTNNMVNEARFGWFKDRQSDDFNSAIQAGYAIGNVGLSVGSVALGSYNILPRVEPSENRFQFVDNLSWVKGSHSMKFGMDISHTEDYQDLLSGRFGAYTYTSVTGFAQDYTSPAAGPSHYSSYSQSFGNPYTDTNVTELGFYAQDTWKPTTKLTVNAGLRYEYTVLPQPTSTNSAYPQTGKIPSFGKDFGPRVGLSYALTDKTVLRLGYGIFYARYETGLINSLFDFNGVYTQSLSITGPTAAGAPIFPNVLASSAAATGASSITFAGPNFRNPYSEQGDVAIERQLSKNTTMSVSYIWNRAKQMYTVRDLNIGPLSSTVYNFTVLNSSYQPTGQVYSTPIYLLSNRIDKAYQHVNEVENGGKQWYDALAIQLNHTLGWGFSGTVAYTWSHELDENQGQGAASFSDIFFSSGPMGLYNGNYAADKGSGTLDQRHRFVSTFTWQPKIMKGNSFMAKYLVNGWQWSGILTLASGRPSPESITSALSASTSPQAFTTSLDGLGGDFRVPFLQNNPLMIDPITRFDTRISKIIPIGEKMSLGLNFEVFNLTNTISNTAVNSTAFALANKGTLAAPNFVLAPCASATATTCSPQTPGAGNTSGGFPDGTNARRAQVSVRFTF
jgi:hypothetical protein